ncbi:hypothetical protein BBROOKSOX_1039 [Bathymodiolus brooksi thiotrophic gill symbiont]|nr:hypothetical protein BBROOKSOX_1039 [Bathymodiolus brooksi thiotrophic gill symbiont]
MANTPHYININSINPTQAKVYNQVGKGLQSKQEFTTK